MYSISRWFMVVAVFILVGVLASGAAYGANASGYCYLEGETNHAGTKVDFIAYPLGEVFCYTTTTNSSGYYSKSLMAAGHYDVICSHPGFVPDGLAYVEIVGSTTIPTLTLHPVFCGGLDWQEYPYVPSGTSIWFPEDEGKHDPLLTYPIEWWYVNFHLTGRTTGREYGAMVAIFKDGPMRLFSISDLYQQQTYTHADLPGVLVASTSELDLHYTDQIGDPDIWRNMNYVAADLNCNGNLMPFTYRLAVDATAREDGNPMKLDIIMASTKAPMIVGGDGIIHVGSDSSYYYSHTKVKVLDESEITVHGLTEKISGYAWIDHQWGDFLSVDTKTWEWFSIKLDDLREIMVADVWVNGERLGSDSSRFNFFNADCSLELSDDYTITPLQDWTDPVSGLPFITQWRIEEESKDIDLIVTADYNNQMMQVEILEVFPFGCFWEGVCSVTGTIEGVPVSGKAYAELTHSRVVPPCRTWLVKPDGTGDFPTVQDAINAANNCDTILLSYGTYRGVGNWDIDFLGKSIVVKSTSGNPYGCIINCYDAATPHRGFIFHSDESSTSRLERITILKGLSYDGIGGGIFCSFSSPVIKNCRIIDCYVDNYGGGIYCESCSPTFEDCTISGNDASSDGGGIFCYLSSPTISHCIFSGNNAFGSGGGLASLASNCSISNCTFSGNKASSGGAILNNALDPTPSYVNISHSILWDDCASGQGDEICNIRGGSNPPAVVYFYCCDVDSLKLSGSGAYVFNPPNINTDPMFCNPDTCVNAPTTGGNYCLRLNSPCLPNNQPVCGLIGALGLAGDCNGNEVVELGDLVYLITYLYKNGPSPDPLSIGDVNCDGIVSLGDAVYLISYLYKNGKPPCYYCPE
jgi:parallel beta-helix repeat protein